MTYLEACEKDPGIKELHDRYLALMKEAGDFAGRAFALWMERYFDMDSVQKGTRLSEL